MKFNLWRVIQMRHSAIRARMMDGMAMASVLVLATLLAAVNGVRIFPGGGAEKDHYTYNGEELDYRKLFDGSISTNISDGGCYQSLTKGSFLDYAWVEVYLQYPSEISSVSVQNFNGDEESVRSESEYMFVKMCRGTGESRDCQTCGQILDPLPSQWSTLTCPSGFVADTIRFEHISGHYIKLCEVNIQTPRASGSRIIPIGGNAKDAFKSLWDYKNLFDMNVSPDVSDNGCYHSGSTGSPWVEVYLPYESEITSVSVKNRGVCCAWKAEGIKVKVCGGRGATYCELCGVIESAPLGGWINVTCPAGGLVGESIRFEHNYNYIHLCEIYISAPRLSGRGKSITPIGGDRKDVWSADWDFTNLYDGENSCYRSGTSKDAWVELYLPTESIILSVSFPNLLAEKAEGIEVKVCTGPGPQSCQLCGIIMSTPLGDWIHVPCAAGMYGDTIRLEHKYNYIHLCEIDVQGVIPDHKRIVPKYGGMPGINTFGNFLKLYDGETRGKDGSDCYFSASSASPWIEVYLASDVAIGSVFILTRADSDADLAVGMGVKVCNGHGGADCTLCGNVTNASANAWSIVHCIPPSGQPPISGNTIRFEHNKFIQICEIYIQDWFSLRRDPVITPVIESSVKIHRRHEFNRYGCIVPISNSLDQMLFYALQMLDQMPDAADIFLDDEYSITSISFTIDDVTRVSRDPFLTSDSQIYANEDEQLEAFICKSTYVTPTCELCSSFTARWGISQEVNCGKPLEGDTVQFINTNRIYKISYNVCELNILTVRAV